MTLLIELDQKLNMTEKYIIFAKTTNLNVGFDQTMTTTNIKFENNSAMSDALLAMH